MFKRVVVFTLFTVLLIVAVSGVSAQTSVTLPTPSGEYAVSRVDRALTDAAREEIFTADAGDQRHLVVTFYYPADPADNAEYAPYLPEASRRALVEQGVPYMLTGLAATQVYENQSISEAEASYPVLIFSPGFGALPASYTSLLTEIASHGYIIAVISHTYSTAVTEFPDGTVIPANAAGLNIGIGDTFEAMGVVWFADATFVLGELAAINADDPLLAGKLDLTHVGAFGHSFGGATAAMLTAHSENVLAGINMDGSQYGDINIDFPIGKPFMFMASDQNAQTEPTDEELAAAGITREDYDGTIADFAASQTRLLEGADPGYSFVLSGSAHNTYATDYGFFLDGAPAFFPPEVIGTLEAETAYTIITRYILTFFDQHVLGAQPTLETLNFQEVEFTTVDNGQ